MYYIQEVDFTRASGLQAVDPVPDLITGNGISSDPTSLASLGRPVSGVAADGASRLVLRALAASVGDTVTLTLFNDQDAQSNSPTADGILTSMDGTVASSQIQATAVSTAQGPMAFAFYLPPTDFARVGNAADSLIYQRYVFIQEEDNQTGAQAPTPILILRPPVLLVHGLWGSPSDFAGIQNSLTSAASMFCPQACIGTADYSDPTPISSPIPSYPSSVLGSALGFAYNAPTVLGRIEKEISNFRYSNNAAATQVDVVAHSMGGDITRMLATLPNYQDSASFGIGNVHKLITIGTPFLGSPVPNQLFLLQNSCPAYMLGQFGGKWSIAVADVAGVQWNGAVNDLQTGSTAFSILQNSTGPGVATGIIAATTIGANLANMPVGSCNPLSNNPSLCGGVVIQTACSTSPLAQALTPNGWTQVLGGPADGIVPLTSQVNNYSGGSSSSPIIETGGLIHSAGLLNLGLIGPTVLDANNIPGNVSINIVNDIVTWLNAPFSTFQIIH